MTSIGDIVLVMVIYLYAILFFNCILYNILDDGFDLSKKICDTVLIILMVLEILGSGIVFGIAYTSYDTWYKSEYTNTLSYAIVSLERDSEVEGDFILGSGYIDEDMYYYYYERVDRDTYHLDKIKVKDNVYIKEVDDGHYYIYEYKQANDDVVYTYIVVPRGTIIQEYRG